MALVVNTNVASLNAQRNLHGSQALMQTSMQRLSSGLRINSAKDDAAGLAIADGMTSQIRGLNQAVRNANDGISLLQTAEGAMHEVTQMLQRMRELAIQSANDSYTDVERGFLDSEFLQLRSEIDRIAASTEFNGVKVIDGSATTDLDFQVGAENDANNRITISLSTIDADSTALGVNLSAIDTKVNAQSAIGTIDIAIQRIDEDRGTLGAYQSRFESTIANLMNVSENLAASRSRIMDADIAMETANMTKANILQQAGVSILAQANQTTALALSLLQG